MDAPKLSAMLATDRAEWAALCAALDAHPEGALHDPESPEWTARDVYTHIARMMDSTTTIMEVAIGLRAAPERGAFDEFGGGDEDAVNARIQQKYAHQSLDEARAWAQQEFDRRIRAIESVPEDRWDDRLEEVARGDGAKHYGAHRSWIVA